MKEAIRELKNERLLVFKTTEYGPEVTAAINESGFDYANQYRRKYGLPEVEYGKPSSPPKAEPLPEEVLRALRFKKKR